MFWSKVILLDDKSVLCQSLSFKKLFLKYILKKLSSPKTWVQDVKLQQ